MQHNSRLATDRIRCSRVHTHACHICIYVVLCTSLCTCCCCGCSTITGSSYTSNTEYVSETKFSNEPCCLHMCTALHMCLKHGVICQMDYQWCKRSDLVPSRHCQMEEAACTVWFTTVLARSRPAKKKWSPLNICVMSIRLQSDSFGGSKAKKYAPAAAAAAQDAAAAAAAALPWRARPVACGKNSGDWLRFAESEQP